MVFRQIKPFAFAVSAMAMACGAASAQTADASNFRFSGFGTFGGVVTDTDRGEFITPGQANGATKTVDFGVDSRVGIQGAYQFNTVFSSTVQVLSKQNGEGAYDPAIEWAFVKAQVTPKLGFRAGRIGAPYFMISDYRDVNYTNLWVRPPLETYGQVPVSHFDGADAIFQQGLGPVSLSLQLWGGRATAKLPTSDVTVTGSKGLNITAEFDNGLTLRAGHAQGKVTFSNAQLSGLQGFAATSAEALSATPFGAAALATAGELSTSERDSSFSGVGFSWDSGNWRLDGEYTYRHIDAYLGDSTGWFVSAGYRIGKFTPFVYASQLKISGVAQNGFAPAAAALGGGLAVLSGGIDSILNSARAGGQRSLAIGARWDVWKSAALKAQLEHIRPIDNGVGLFKVPAGTTSLGEKNVNVLSVSVDFVF